MNSSPDPIDLHLLDLFRIGPGPSSSHTVGPMRAARWFRQQCLQRKLQPARLQVILQGSLSATGRGHGTDRAVLAGLLGWEPETCDTEALLHLPQALAMDSQISFGEHSLNLPPEHVVFAKTGGKETEALPHPNTMVFAAFDAKDQLLHEMQICSVGGGFVQQAENIGQPFTHRRPSPAQIPFHDGDSLLAAALQHKIALGDVVLRNERAWEEESGSIKAGLSTVMQAFRDCIARGLDTTGELPGGLQVQRRAGQLLTKVHKGQVDPAYAPIARAQAYAYAINEENAAGGRVVTAPTNGAAGIFPAVLVEAADRLHLDDERIHRAMATGGAIAMVIKTHASLSGAEVGCQGEVGSATAMAAAALCQLLGGNPQQVENAAEIGLEHNLGLTCDPIKGLVQAPCIERNAMGVAKAWSAAQLALHSTGPGVVTLDRVIRVMKRTGQDMHHAYKETSEGGLAVSLPEC